MSSDSSFRTRGGVASRPGEIILGTGETGVFRNGDFGIDVGDISSEYRRDEGGGVRLSRLEDFRGGIGGGNFVAGTDTLGLIFRVDGEDDFERTVILECDCFGGVGRAQVGGDDGGLVTCLGSSCFVSDSVGKPMSSIVTGASGRLFRRALRMMTLVSLKARSWALAICASYSEKPNGAFSPAFFLDNTSSSCAVANTASCLVPSQAPGGTSSLTCLAG